MQSTDERPASGHQLGAGLAIQIVSFDWPWPANYGGVIDVACKIEALLALGVDVVLHVVSYPRVDASPAPTGPGGKLTIFEYGRRRKSALLSRKPFIVSSRAVSQLLPTLASGPEVILFEGIHTTAYLGHPRLGGHQQWLRVHNREADYYSGLATKADSVWRRLFFAREARLLRRYEAETIRHADWVLPITQRDQTWVSSLVDDRQEVFSPFTCTKPIGANSSVDDYALCHGAFHVADNEQAALRCIARFAERPTNTLIVAGRQPTQAMRQAVAAVSNVQLIADPSAVRMSELLHSAQVIVLDSHEQAGFKLKLLESARCTATIVCSEAIAYGATQLTEDMARLEVLHICKTEDDWQPALTAAFAKTADPQVDAMREQLLEKYSAESLAKRLTDRLRKATFTIN